MTDEKTYYAQVILTVAESKRLIARGVAADARVKRALDSGWVAVAKGSTNAYVVEELTGERIDKTKYVTGFTVPAGKKPGTDASLADLVLRRGERVEGLTAVEAVAKMKAGDVFIKGANAINYERDQAAILVGHPQGGTVGATIGTVVARRIEWICPAGLEKDVPGDLVALAAEACEARAERVGDCPTLWVLPASPFTELDALGALVPGLEISCVLAAGGIRGAEGAVRLLLASSYDRAPLDAALELVASVQGEPPFGE